MQFSERLAEFAGKTGTPLTQILRDAGVPERYSSYAYRVTSRNSIHKEDYKKILKAYPKVFKNTEEPTFTRHKAPSKKLREKLQAIAEAPEGSAESAIRHNELNKKERLEQTMSNGLLAAVALRDDEHLKNAVLDMVRAARSLNKGLDYIEHLLTHSLQ